MLACLAMVVTGTPARSAGMAICTARSLRATSRGIPLRLRGVWLSVRWSVGMATSLRALGALCDVLMLSIILFPREFCTSIQHL